MSIQFAKNSIVIVVQESPSFVLRAVSVVDLENLRQWKNEQREFFFHKDEISPQQQRNWYAAYQRCPNDFMFMTILDGQSFGCMGIRWLENVWDIYNVILGRSEFGSRGLMRKAFKIMIAHVLSIKESPITLQVLKLNPAVDWYLKNEFFITAECDDHYSMTYHSNINPQDTP